MKDWDDFKFLLAIRRAGNMAGAARLLNTDATTVARRVRRLSEQFGYPMVFKSGQNWTISPKARELIRLAEHFDQSLATIANKAHDQTIGPRVQLTLHAPSYINTFLLHSLGSAAEAFAPFDLSLIGAECSEALGQADVVISSHRPRAGRLRVTKVGETEVQFWRPLDPPAGPAPVPGQWIGISEAAGCAQLARLGTGHYPTPPHLLVDSFEKVYYAILGTGLPGPLPAAMATLLPGIAPQEGGPRPFTLGYWLFYHESRKDDPAIAALIEFVRIAGVTRPAAASAPG